VTVTYTGERRRALEQRIGRALTAAEQHIQVEQIDETLNRAKDLLDAEIRAEQARLATAIADGHGGQLTPTPRMLAILAGLREHGAAHALSELASMGYPTRARRQHQAPSDDELAGRLRARLGDLTIKVQQHAVGLDLSSLATAAIEKALSDVLGARAIAADLVAPAFDAGLGDTFEQHADLVEAWQYTAVLDAGSCDPCSELDGTEYDSWDAIQEVLPDGGPSIVCEGGDRCRCRAVPLPPSG
jgi:hypothetical protein